MHLCKPKPLIFTILVVCALIMGIVFYYHYQHPSQSAMVANDQALMFAQGREIKPFSLVTLENQPFTEKNFRQHWTLLFFGFTHCLSVCPTTLSMLSEAYPILHTQYPNLQVVLVSLDPSRDTPVVVNQYAQQFHTDFQGVTGKLQEVRKLQAQLGIASQQDDSTAGSNYQIIHTSSIMLINPRGEWVGLFKYGMGAKDFTQTYQDSMHGFGVKSA